MASDHDIFDRRLLTRRRNRAAAHAAAHEYLLEQVADDLIARLIAINREFPVALNLGAHHGLMGRRLRAVRDVALVIDADPAALLLAQCDGPRVQADEELLPFADGSLDLVVSGLALHMVNDLPGSLLQIRRALKPGGLLLAAALGGNTLRELRHSLLIAEEESEHGGSPRIAPFADIRQFGALLQRANFALPVVDSWTPTVTYADAASLMRELKAMGATNVLNARRRTPLRRSTLLRAVACYSEQFGLANGRVPATFEIITMTGWASHVRESRSVASGSSVRAGRTEAADGGASHPASR